MRTMRPFTPGDIDAMVRETIRYYDDNAKAYWAGTRNHDVSQNRDTLLRYIEAEPPFRILDLGCGPGRDLRVFREIGHEPIGLDAAAQLCEIAQESSGCEVWQQDFLDLDLPDSAFDGVFANASLFHVPTRDIQRVLVDLRRTLKPEGVLLVSNPRGQNQETWQVDRFGVFYDLEEWSRLVAAAGFEGLEHYYRPPGRPRHQQNWLVTVWRNPG